MKAYKIIYFSFMVLLFASCNEDLLNTIPKDRLASELFWQTEQDAIYASNGIYAVLGDQGRYSSMDAYTDIAHFILQWRAESEVEKHTFSSSNNIIASEWSYYYNIIQASSSFLENVDQVKEMNDVLRKRLKAEAKTLRAFAYINLVMLYGDVPLVTKSLTVAEAKSISQTSASSIWDFIAEELTSASADLPTVQEEKGRVTKGIALGLKARAMLYAGRYQDAKTAAKSVMDLGIYQIHDSYAELFDYAGEESSEIIFARQYAQNLNAHSIFRFFTANSLYTQSCQVVPTKPLVDAYLMKSTGLPIEDPASGFDPYNPYIDRDPRLYYTVYINGDVLANGEVLNSLPGSGTGDDITISAENVTPTGWYFKKYVSNADYNNPWNCGINLIYLRYAEILLTYAEACVELGENEINQSVLNALNEIRNRTDVNMPNVTTLNQTELRRIIRRERLVELAMEGHRLYDIRRWRIGEEVIPGTIKGMTYEDPQNPGTLVTAGLSGYVKEFKPDRHYLWPIPFRELDLNKNLTQNTGF
ncbi:RagB/SusD family nutrient uptake outer membrane protein [Maribellus luteus]|uniref:RagB/SusD family nutrient uptake outer membrane protein n=1 Tax=Maribellus luteus TaxID=2305463 RepID=A0A399SMY9_9BACT|nr:RagB/SusD family nutrient uptake outer membrane protein [Maribellus luteus]RIJ45366.1 RagB/SusD family nutrient uptake outer membrane protein [Maribellus luteus]